MYIHLKIVGFILVILAFAHLVFPKYFKWRKELEMLSLINRQMMYIHTFFIALSVFLMGLICIFSTEEIIETILGKRLSLGLFIFWGFRLLFQFVGYSPALWKGKTFETSIHIIFSLIWIYITSVFLLIAFDGNLIDFNSESIFWR